MLVPGNDGRQILEIGSKFLKCDLIARLNVIPAPYEFVEYLLLLFLVSNHLRVSGSVIDFTQLLQGDFRADYLPDSVISIFDRLHSVGGHFAPQIGHKLAVGNIAITGFEVVAYISYLFLS